MLANIQDHASGLFDVLMLPGIKLREHYPALKIIFALFKLRNQFPLGGLVLAEVYLADRPIVDRLRRPLLRQIQGEIDDRKQRYDNGGGAAGEAGLRSGDRPEEE